MEDAPKLLKIPKSECPDIWIRLPRHKWPKSWSSMEDPVVPLERNLYSHPLAGLLWERQFENILLKHGWEKIPNWECLFVHREKGLFVSVYVDDIKLAGRKHNINPMWKVLNKEVDLGEPTSFLDHVYLGCTQRQCEISKDIVENYRTMFESRISAVRVEKLPFTSKSSYFFMVLWHGWSCKEVCGTILWVGKQDDSTTLQSIYSMPWRPSFQRRRNWNPWENCQTYALKLFWNAYSWNVLDDPIFYGQWTNLRDQSLNGPKQVTNDYLVWSLHSLQKWIQTILSCEKHCKTVQTGTVSRLRLCRRSWGLVSIRRGLVHFRKPHVCSN